ncbi:fimbrial protein [Burkholderia alba]|uniref:fimbrial protein n=1 Tax=Burkholderia alba TaxID=2683677 RepID=UPI002B05D758|nr:fimbrial protein [Burkholderia alba]
MQQRRSALGGVNLLPYRARDTRRVRRRIVCEISVAALVGLAAMAIWSAARAVQSARFDAQRRQVEQRLAAWAPQLVAAEQAARLFRDEQMRGTQALERAAPRRRVLDLFDLLRRVRYDGVRLRSIRAGESEASIEVSAADPAAATHWLRQIQMERGDWTFEVAGLQAVHAVSARESGQRRALAFSVRIRWPSPGPARAAGVAREGA